MQILKCKTAMIIICHRIECCWICNPLCYGLQVELIMVGLMVIVTLLVRTHICLLWTDWDRNFLQTKSYSKILPIITHLRDERFCWRCFYITQFVHLLVGYIHSTLFTLKYFYWNHFFDIFGRQREKYGFKHIIRSGFFSHCLFHLIFFILNIFHSVYDSTSFKQREREW